MAFLIGKMQEDADLVALVPGGMWDSMAVPGSPRPYVILAQMSYVEAGTSIEGEMGAARIEMMIKVITDGNSYESGEAILKKVHVAVNKQKGVAAGVTVRSCVRIGGTRYPEVDRQGRRYNHLGSIYLMFVSEGETL